MHMMNCMNFPLIIVGVSCFPVGFFKMRGNQISFCLSINNLSGHTTQDVCVEEAILQRKDGTHCCNFGLQSLQLIFWPTI